MLAVLKRMKNTVGNGSTFKNSNNDAVNGPIKFRTDKAGFVQLNLHVKPGAKVTKVAEINENHIGLQISAPPRDGEANEEVIRYIAEIFKLKGRHVNLISGGKCRDKIIVFENLSNFSLEEIEVILINNQSM